MCLHTRCCDHLGVGDSQEAFPVLDVFGHLDPDQPTLKVSWVLQFRRQNAALLAPNVELGAALLVDFLLLIVCDVIRKLFFGLNHSIFAS